MFVCFPSVFSSKTFFQEQSSEFPWCFLQKFRVLVFIKCSFQFSTLQNQQSFATVAFYKPPGLMWRGMVFIKWWFKAPSSRFQRQCCSRSFYKGHCCIGMYSFKYFQMFVLFYGKSFVWENMMKKQLASHFLNWVFLFFFSYVGGWPESFYKKDGFCVCCLRNMILEVG